MSLLFDWLAFGHHFFQWLVSPHPMQVSVISGVWVVWTDGIFGLSGWHATFSKWDVELQGIFMVETAILKLLAENILLKWKGRFWTIWRFYFYFWRALCSAWWIFCKLSELLPPESFWYYSIFNHPDSSVILTKLFLFSSLSLTDLKEELADSAFHFKRDE